MYCSKCGEVLKDDDRFCSKCGNLVEGDPKKETSKTEVITSDDNTNVKESKDNTNDNMAAGCGCLVLVIIGIIILFVSCSASGSDKSPSYYDTRDPNDMTNKEMEQFIEWKLKENQREYDNRKFNE